MRVAIDCRLWGFPNASKKFFGAALLPSFLEAAPDNIDMYTIWDKPPDKTLQGLEKTTTLVLRPVAGNTATRILFYDLSLPAYFQRHQIDVFIGCAGYISFRTEIPQYLWLHDALRQMPVPAPAGWQGPLYKKRLSQMLYKSAGNLIALKSDKKLLPRPITCQPDKVLITGPALYYPVVIPSKEENNTVKAHWTGGMEYFICMEGWDLLEHFLELLLAFSTFKKRQQTGMKLLLVGDPPAEKEWSEKLNTYRYREDIVLTGKLDPEIALSLLSAGYGLVHLPGQPWTQWLLKALARGVPVIAPGEPSFKEIAGDYALYLGTGAGESLPQRMMQLYKDESIRSNCLKMAPEFLQKFTPASVAKLLWQPIIKMF